MESQRRLKMLMRVLFVLIFIFEQRVLTQTPHVCVGINECKCQFQDDGSVIDITSLGNRDGSPRFKDVLSKDGYLYSYNPCGAFTEFSCANAAVCRKDRTSGQTEMTGAAEMPQFTYDELTGDTVIGYTAGMLGNIHTFVYLICDDSQNPGPPQFYPNGTQSENLYILTVRSACACGNRCDANGIIGQDSSSKLNYHYIILIVVVCVVVLYFTIGTVLRVKTGTNILPTRACWCNLPNCIKSGCSNICRRGKYESI